SATRAKAAAAGFDVFETGEAVRRADVVMVLLPDELQPAAFESEIAPNLRDGAYLGFAHGFGIHFEKVRPSKSVNVFLVAPKGPGHLVRRQFASQSGTPCLFA